MAPIDEVLEKYSDVPRSVVLKYEFSRRGLATSERAVRAFQNLDTVFKGYQIFSWDSGRRNSGMDKVPQDLQFTRDDTMLANRTNPNSPYVIDFDDGRFHVCQDGEPIEDIYFPRQPGYYSRTTSRGIPMAAIVPKLGCMLYTAINKYCEFWKDHTECQFCDFMSVTRDQAKKGELGVTNRPADLVAEVMKLAVSDPLPMPSRHWVVSGGWILQEHHGMAETEYYARHLESVFEKLGSVFPTSLQSVPRDVGSWRRLKQIGLLAVQPNMEVWDRQKFKAICPGKDKYVGWDEYVRRILTGVEVFGPGKVNPNFVIGVEMSKPWGFSDPVEAADSTLTGFDYLMRNGVFPRCAVWLPVAGSALGAQTPPPLDYYIRVGKGYRELRHRYGFGDNLPCFCRGCNTQDTLHDWEYVDQKAAQKANA